MEVFGNDAHFTTSTSVPILTPTLTPASTSTTAPAPPLSKQSEPPTSTRQRKPPGPSICAICGKTFNRSYNLEVHFRKHTGEKPFECPIKSCLKRFTWRSSMTHHVRAHHGPSDFIDSELPVPDIQNVTASILISMTSKNKQSHGVKRDGIVKRTVQRDNKKKIPEKKKQQTRNSSTPTSSRVNAVEEQMIVSLPQDTINNTINEINETYFNIVQNLHDRQNDLQLDFPQDFQDELKRELQQQFQQPSQKRFQHDNQCNLELDFQHDLERDFQLELMFDFQQALQQDVSQNVPTNAHQNVQHLPPHEFQRNDEQYDRQNSSQIFLHNNRANPTGSQNFDSGDELLFYNSDNPAKTSLFDVTIDPPDMNYVSEILSLGRTECRTDEDGIVQ